MNSTRADLVAKVANAASFNEQMEAVKALDAFDRGQRTAKAQDRSLDLASTVVEDTLRPVAVHERSTIQTDWLGVVEASAGGTEHTAVAEATLWFGRTTPEVRADVTEFGIQAEGAIRRIASAYGEQMPAVEALCREHVGRLWRMQREGASGLDQIQQTVDPHDNPKTTPLDPSVFDNFAPDVDPVNAGVVGTETSERAPLIQEILQEGGGQGQPEKPGGHLEGPDFSNSYSEVESAEPGQMIVQHSSLDAPYTDGPSVAISHVGTLDDFRMLAASGLDEIQQVVNPHEDPDPTPLPEEVMFPWLLDTSDGKNTKPVAKTEAAKTAAPSHDDYETHYVRGYKMSGHYGEPQADVHARYGSQFDPEQHGDPDEPFDLSRAESLHIMTHPRAVSGPNLNAFNDGWSDRANGTRTMWENRPAKRTATRKVADQWGASDAPHSVVQPDVANSSATTPDEAAGAAQGRQDALSGDRPTYADASSSVPGHVREYSQAYAETAQQVKDDQPKDMPHSLATTKVARVSDRFVKAASRQDPDFAKGYGFASKWKPGSKIVSTGSLEFESGLFAGIADNPDAQEAWGQANRYQATKDERFARRLAAIDAYASHLSDEGIDITQRTAGTTTDADVTGPLSSASPTGTTPINGPGQPGPLDGQVGAAEPGGPSPYNGAEPFGSPVVPTGAPAVGNPGVIDASPGAPVDSDHLRGNPRAAAFRKTVQASLQSQKG